MTEQLHLENNHLNNNPGLVTDRNNLKRGKGGENRRKEVRKDDRGEWKEKVEGIKNKENKRKIVNAHNHILYM